MKKIAILALLLFSFCCAFAQQPIYRYYNAKMKKHYFTRDFNEYGPGTKDWASEGVSCLAFTTVDPTRGIIPVYRFFNPQTGDHYYTSKHHLQAEARAGYQLDGPAFYVYNHKASGTTELFEYYSPSSGDHFFTADKNELGPGFEGYQFEDVIGFVFRRAKQ
jgi:hypothetical protein